MGELSVLVELTLSHVTVKQAPTNKPISMNFIVKKIINLFGCYSWKNNYFLMYSHAEKAIGIIIKKWVTNILYHFLLIF